MAQKLDTIVMLGDFKFENTEVPEKVPFGGKQKLAVHELVGGIRIVDSMGGFDAPIEWSGLLLGPKAVAHAKQLDTMRRAGKRLNLQWHEFKYQVVVESFSADFERFYQIPYRIVCTVVQPGAAAPVPGDFGLSQIISSDMASVNLLVANLNISSMGSLSSTISGQMGQLSSLTSTLSSAVGQVSDFANAAQSTINGVLAPLAAVRAQVGGLIASVSNIAANVTTLGGVLPNNPISQAAARLSSQVVSQTSLPQLYNLNSVLGRMGSNLTNSNNSGQVVTTAGGNLMSMASQVYGDATAWPLLAQANKLKDPVLQGIASITIPPAPNISDLFGGVLSG